MTDWLDETERLDMGATYGPWQAISTGDKGSTFIEAEHVDVLNHDETGHGHLRSEYAWMTKEDADWIAWSRTALPQAVAALRAVADLHQPDACWMDRLDCGACSSYDECVQWPCPTIQAIQAAIGG